MRIQPAPLALILAALFCAPALAPAADDSPAGAPTFARDVAPIFQSKCMECHRPGEVAPMALTSYEETRPWVKSIRTEVAAKRMPPWHADAGAHAYANDSSLTEDEIKTVLAWIDGGAVPGDLSKMPANPEFSHGWKLGEPDLVLTMPIEYELGPEGDEVYHCFVMPAAEEEKWIEGVEFRPGNRAINHHVVLFLDGKGEGAVKLDERHEGPGYPCYGSPGFGPSDILGVWAPGADPDVLPGGIARLYPKGSRIVMQVHYHRNGQAEKDRSSVGLKFASEPVQQRLRLGIAVDPTIQIAAGEKEYVSSAWWYMPKAATIRSIFPHMHLLGTSIAVIAHMPDGKENELLKVGRYDFNWQRTYELANPVEVPAKTKIEVRAIYDNSAENPNNPNSPPADVRFGFATTDEMNVGFVYYTQVGEDLTKPESGGAGAEGSAISDGD